MKTIDGKSDRKKEATGRKMKPLPPPTNHPRRVKNKLYVCGLLPHVLREDVIREFSVYGKLQEVWVAKKPAGFAFVEFVNARDAERVVHELDGKKIFGSQLRIEFAKSKDNTESKEPKRNPQGNPPLLSLEQTFMPLKIPLLGPPMPVSNSKPLLDAKPLITHSYKHHSGASNEAISPSRIRKRLTSLHHKPSKNYLSPPSESYYRRRSPDHRHWHYEEHMREEEYYGAPPRSRPYSRRVYRSPVRFPRHDSPHHNRPFKGPISPIRDRCIDDESSGSDKRTFSNVKSQVKSVKKALRECLDKEGSEEDDRKERSKSYKVERKRHKESPEEEASSHAKYRRSSENSAPISLSRTRLLGRTPPSPSRSSHRSVSQSSSGSSKQHTKDEGNGVKPSQSPPPRKSVSYNKSFPRKSSSLNKSSSTLKLSKTKNNRRPESSISSTSSSSIDSKNDKEKEKEMVKVKQKGKRKVESSSSSSPSCERRVVKEKSSRHSSSDSRKTPLAYQQRRGSFSGVKSSPVPHSPPIKLPPRKVYRSKEYIPRHNSPSYPSEYVRSRHSPIPHRPYPPYERSPEPKRYYEEYPSRPYYVERDEYREPVYYKRKYYTQDYHEPHYYRRPYVPQPPPYRRREIFHEDEMYYPPPRKVPFVYRGKIRNPPIIYTRGESKKE